MTVLERFITMVSTGFSGANLLLGTALKEVMYQVVDDLNTNCSKLEIGEILYNEGENYYSPMFYHITWNALVRPTVEMYLRKEYPTAWFNQFYIPNLNPN